jgi:TatD DNase family protein
LEIGFYISLAGVITFKNATDLRAVVAELPLDRLLVETDAPYLAPVPKRGKKNEPAFVRHTAEALAAERGLEAELVIDVTGDNFFALFSKVARPTA